MPCGGGKTVVGVAAIGDLGRTALVIVHTRDLVDQWIAMLGDRLELIAGVVTEGEVRPGVVTVATVQTLVRLDDAAVEDSGATTSSRTWPRGRRWLGGPSWCCRGAWTTAGGWPRS
jgi:superfamily II DNA or RNA helicase